MLKQKVAESLRPSISQGDDFLVQLHMEIKTLLGLPFNFIFTLKKEGTVSDIFN